LIEVGVAIDQDFELAGAELAHPAGMLGAQRDNESLARDPQRVGHREDALDFRQSNRLEQCHVLRRVRPEPPLYIRRGSPKLNHRGA